ncbi:MAG TPA: S8 family serine peptidase [Terriglobales bacterium]|nr:S8 family serine peptidase [Terriglobales bacterium]
MKCVVLAILLLLMPAIVLAQFRPQARGRRIEGEIIVKMRSDVSASALNDLLTSAEVTPNVQGEPPDNQVIARVGSFHIRRLRSRLKNTDTLLTRLRQNPRVLYAEPNYLVSSDSQPNDNLFNQQWALSNTGQRVHLSLGQAGADIKAVDAWTITTGSPSIVVGVVDTGIDYNHPDLAANVWNNPGGIGGCAAGTHGFNAISGACDPRDDNYHGTHVAGILGAVGNNGQGVVGVNWNTSIMGLKALDATGNGTIADVIRAIEFAIQAKQAGINIRVLTASWSLQDFSQALLDEMARAESNDIMIVAAAGNAAANNGTTAIYPANFKTGNLISVAASDNYDQLAYFSNYGATTVHLAAPGQLILSTVPNSTYDYLSGTSMSVPYVAGAAALVLSRGNLSTPDLKQWLLDTVDPLPAMRGLTITGGRLNLLKAVSRSSNPLPAAPVFVQTPTDPTGINVAVFAFSSTISGAAFQCSLSASAIPVYTACVSPVISPPLPDGRYIFAVRAVDAGLAGQPATYAFTVDTVAPVVTITQRPADTTSNTTATFAFSAADAVRFDCSFAASSQADSFQTCVSPKAFTGLALGSYTFKVRAADAVGNLSLPVSATFSVVAVPPPPPAPNTFRDDFNTPVLNPAWIWVDPVGNSTWSQVANPGYMQIALPAGSTHNCWPGLQSCVRMMKALDAGNFVAETRIDGAALGPRAQAYGILLWQNSNNYVRFEFWTYGTGVIATAWRVINGAGSQALPLSYISLGSSNGLRVTRTGNTYSMDYSLNRGVTWNFAGSFTQVGFVPVQAGLEVANYELNPATTANFDYFSLAPAN